MPPVATKPAPKLSGPVGGAVSSITNRDFSQLDLNTSATVAGVISEIKEKEGTFAPVTQFKGHFALQRGNVINTARTLYVPEVVKTAIRAEAAKIAGGWETLEFCAVVTRTEKGYTVSFKIAPRKEQDKALSLLKS